MWNRNRIPVAIIGLGLVAGVASADVSFAARSRDYTPRELRTVLRGFGYNITPGDTLNDKETVAVVRQFQQGYRIQVDGIAGPQTQNLAADLVKILKANLNLVLKPSPALPSTQFWDERTEAAIKRYQEQSNLAVTGIATLQLRQKLDQEAESILKGTSSPTPTPTPRTAPQTAPSTAPSPQRSPAPSTAPSQRTNPAPSTAPSPQRSPAPSTAPSPQTSPAPSTAPSPQRSPAPSTAPNQRTNPAPTTAPSPQTSPAPAPGTGTTPPGSSR